MQNQRTKIGIFVISFFLLIGMFPAWAALAPNSSPDMTAQAASNNTVNYTVSWASSPENSIDIKYSSSEKRGWVYYSVRSAGSDAPTSNEILSENGGNNWFPAGTALGRKDGSLTVDAGSTSAKDVYLVFMEYPSSSNVVYDVTKISLPARSSGVTITGTSSKSGSVSFKAARKDSSNASLTVTPSVSGTLHYIVKGDSESAPTNTELLNAAGISESANVTKTSTIPLGDNPTDAKKIYVLYVSSGGTQIGSGSIDIAAYNTGSYSAEIKSDSLYLGTVTDDYEPANVSQTATISNTGAGTLTFSVDTSADGYDTFSQYFTVDTSGAKNIASGSDGSVTVRPKEGLDPGTYSASFSLIDKVSDDKTLTLGPVKAQMVVVKKGDSMPDGIRPTQGEYTPGSESLGGGTDTNKITIDNKVAYCVNYYFNLSNQSNTVMDKIYKNKFGKLPNVTAQEMDAYTGLNLNAETLYPPNNNGYTPVKSGDPDSETLANVRKVLYNGYDTDAADIKHKYKFKLLIDYRKDYAFEIATQCAIWHYTDKNRDGSELKYSDLQNHIKDIYTTVPSWGWDDVEEIYNILIGKDTSIQLKEPTDDFETDLFVADNPINGTWTQNLVTGSAKTADVSITKVWDDEGDPNGSRPGPSTFKSWLHLYKGTVDVTSMYADKLTVVSNGNNTYTAKWSGLPGEADQYSIIETIPDNSIYATSLLGNAVQNGGSITNSDTSMAETEISVTKTWKDNSDSLSLRPTQDNYKSWLKLYANGEEVTDAEAAVTGSGDSWTVTYTELPKYDSQHQEIVYTVGENIPDGAKYSASYGSGAEAASDGGVIVNTLTDTTSVTVTKAWQDADGTINAPDGASVTLTLCENGIASSRTITLNGTADSNGESAAWTAEWSDLPKYDSDGTVISYSVYESSGPAGFICSNASAGTALDASGSDPTITNTEIGTASVSLNARKVFSGGTLAGDDFEFKLEKLENGTYSTVETKRNDASGSVSFDAIDYKYSDAGKTYTYRITETDEKKSGIKYDTTVYRVSVSVKRDGAALTATPTYEKSTDGGSTWSPVTEMIFSNTNTNTKSTKWHLEAQKSTTDNSAVPEGAFVFQIYDGMGNPCYLTAEGKITNQADGNMPLTATNDANGNIVFPEVTATEAQTATTYTMKEVGFSSDKYASEWVAPDLSTGFNAVVTVTKDSSGNLSADINYGSTTPEFRNTRKDVGLHLQKNWSGVSSDDQPDSATFVVTRKTADETEYSDAVEDGETVTVTLTKSDGWKGDVGGLSAVNGSGEEYTYSVRETGFSKNGQSVTLNFSVETAAGDDTVNNSTVIKNVTVTNSRSTETVNIPVTKTWADGVSADGVPGKSITVILKQNGTAFGSAVLTASDDVSSNWKHTFSDLDKYAPDGSE